MRITMVRWVAGVVAAGIVLGGVSGAQSPEPACSVGVVAFFSRTVPGIGASPFAATAKTNFEQKLPDGSYVRGYVVTHQARDGAGRTMSEVSQGCWRNENGVPQPGLMVTVYDRAAKTMMAWQVNMPSADKVVRVSHASPTPPKPLAPEELSAREKLLHVQQPQPSEFKKEDLGMRMIAGVEAHGSRTTRTIPPGEEGNEIALVTMNEEWSSKELGLVLLGITDDPRHGRTTYEVEELTVGEPDASLFAPPAGYKVVDLSPPVSGETKQ